MQANGSSTLGDLWISCMLLNLPMPELPELVHRQQEETNWTETSWEMSFRF